MKIYIITHREDETMEMYDYFLKKYWQTADMIVLGYKEPTYKSDFIKFISLGEDLGPNFLNKQLYDYFLELNESQFIFGSDDMPMLRQVNIELINYSEELLKSNDTVGRIGLTADNSTRSHIVVSNISNSINLIENVNNEVDSYKLSGTWSAWNIEYFLLYLMDYDKLWEWEINGSIKSKDDIFRILGYIQPPFIHSHLIKRKKIIANWYEGCVNEGVGILPIEMSYEDKQKIKDIYNI